MLRLLLAAAYCLLPSAYCLPPDEQRPNLPPPIPICVGLSLISPDLVTRAVTFLLAGSLYNWEPNGR